MTHNLIHLNTKLMFENQKSRGSKTHSHTHTLIIRQIDCCPAENLKSLFKRADKSLFCTIFFVCLLFILFALLCGLLAILRQWTRLGHRRFRMKFILFYDSRIGSKMRFRADLVPSICEKNIFISTVKMVSVIVYQIENSFEF